MSLPRPPRWFIADDIPFRYVYISVNPTILDPSGHAVRVDAVFTAVEMLETRGWELVNFEQSGKVAYLRRG